MSSGCWEIGCCKFDYILAINVLIGTVTGRISTENVSATKNYNSNLECTMPTNNRTLKNYSTSFLRLNAVIYSCFPSFFRVQQSLHLLKQDWRMLRYLMSISHCAPLVMKHWWNTKHSIWIYSLCLRFIRHQCIQYDLLCSCFPLERNLNVPKRCIRSVGNVQRPRFTLVDALCNVHASSARLHWCFPSLSCFQFYRLFLSADVRSHLAHCSALYFEWLCLFAMIIASVGYELFWQPCRQHVRTFYHHPHSSRAQLDFLWCTEMSATYPSEMSA